MAANQSVNISVDDGIPLDFLAEMHVAMDCLPVDEEEANRIIAEKLRREQQERVRRFNNAWNIHSIDHEESLPTRSRIATGSSSSAIVPLVESVRDPRIIARNTQTLLANALIQRQTYHPSIGSSNNEPSPLVDAVIQERAKARMLSTNQVNLDDNEEDDDGIVFEEEPREEEQPRRMERSRVPTRSTAAATAQRARPAERSHSRGRRTRRHSRNSSRSPTTHGRRKRHTRSRSRHRSRSYSRSRSSSPCSEHSHGTVDSRGRSSRKQPVVDQASMLQMMAMTMQMFNQMNGTQLTLPAVGARMPYAAAAADPTSGMPSCEAVPPHSLTPAAFRHMFANKASSSRAGRAEEVVDVSSDMSTADILEAGESNRPKYDVSTELFLEGKVSFSDFLSMKPSSTRSDLIAPVDPKVSKRISQAIAVLEQQHTNKQSARFLYVPPTFYDSEDRHYDHTRSPLIWNNQNVLFQFTSNAKETKQFQPFRNVNAKLKDLTLKLGLDEGIVSQQLEKVVHAAAASKRNADNNHSAAGTDALSGRVHAITAVPPKPGTGKVRHLIDRSVQTDGYACTQCVARNKKTFISSFSQTTAPVLRLDAEVQTNGPPLSAPNVVSLDGLNAQQIETVEAIVRFIRARQLAGSIESVQHALRNDRVAGSGMTPAIQHNAQRLMSQVKSDLQRTDSFPGHSSHSHHHGYYSNNYQSMAQPSQQPIHYYDDTPRDHRYRHPGSGITRTVRTTTTTMAEQIIPACYDSQPQLSKKTKKRLKLQQQQQHQQRW